MSVVGWVFVTIAVLMIVAGLVSGVRRTRARRIAAESERPEQPERRKAG